MRIVKKVKNNQKYFYLRHSFREDNKIRTREKYLGTTIPPNIEEIKKEFFKEFKLSRNKKLEEIKKKFQTEWKRVPVSIKEKQLQEISIAFTYNTNAIEGSKITLEETREIIKDKISPNRPTRDVRETENHSKVFLNMLKHKQELTEDLILEWHKQIFLESKPEIAGKYRDYLVTISGHLAPDWQDVKDLMSELFKFIKKEESEYNLVEFCSRVHYKFEKIHPFGDGNGRIGRLIMNFLLWNKGYPMLIIETKKKKAYYTALNKDEEGFVSYFIRTYLKANKRRLK